MFFHGWQYSFAEIFIHVITYQELPDFPAQAKNTAPRPGGLIAPANSVNVTNTNHSHWLSGAMISTQAPVDLSLVSIHDGSSTKLFFRDFVKPTPVPETSSYFFYFPPRGEKGRPFPEAPRRVAIMAPFETVNPVLSS